MNSKPMFELLGRLVELHTYTFELLGRLDKFLIQV